MSDTNAAKSIAADSNLVIMSKPKRESRQRRVKGSGSIYRRGDCTKHGAECQECPGKWYVQYSSNHRVVRLSVAKLRGKPVVTKTEANEALKMALGEVAKGLAPHKYAPVSVGQLWDAFILSRESKCKDSSLENYRQLWRKHLEPYFGNTVVTPNMRERVDAYRTKRTGDGAALCSINSEQRVLKMVVRYASDIDRIPKMPVFPVNPDETGFTRTGTIPQDILKTILAACESRFPWFVGLLTVYVRYGFRKEELLKLRVKDVNFEKSAITLPAFSTKNKRERVVGFQRGGPVEHILQGAVAGKGADDFVFTRNGKQIYDFRATWNHLVKGVAGGSSKAKGHVGEPTIHDLRRTAISAMAEKGIDMATSMATAGHLTATVHNRYKQLTDTARQAAAARIEGD